MKNKWFLFGIFIFIISNIYAYNTDYNNEFYYGEVIDIGISDISNPNIEYINIIIYTDFETLLDNNYTIEEITEIPVYLDNQISSNLKISYKFMGANDILIEEKEFQIDITENTDVGDFYLCNTEDCKNSIPDNYDFWFDEEIFVFSDKINYDKFTYNITTETDKTSDNIVLLTDKNITFPYKILNTTIAGYERYKLTIEILDKVKEKRYTQRIDFALSEITEEENRRIMDQLIEINRQEEINANQEEDSEIIEEQPPVDERPSSVPIIEDSEKPQKINAFLILLIVIFILIILMAVFNKPKKNRRTNRKKR